MSDSVAAAIAESLVASGVFPDRAATDPWVVGPACLAATAAIEAAGWPGWHPIITAPKDREIWLWTGLNSVKARWIDGEPSPNFETSAVRRALFKRHGGYWSAHFRGLQPMRGLPSHWHPLPPPPNEGRP